MAQKIFKFRSALSKTENKIALNFSILQLDNPYAYSPEFQWVISEERQSFKYYPTQCCPLYA